MEDLKANLSAATQQMAAQLNTQLTAAAAGKGVSAVVAQGYEQNINIRLVAGSDIIKNPFFLRCQPRRGADRQDKDMLDLPASILTRFDDINKKVIAWLGQSADNVTLFLQNPVNALQRAGIDLSREEQKHLARNTEAVKEVAVIPPGAVVKQLSAGVHKGKLNVVATHQPDKPTTKDKDCGCGGHGS